jgi:hypothetical protein
VCKRLAWCKQAPAQMTTLLVFKRSQYFLAWLDLIKEPMIAPAPNTNGRYYMLPLCLVRMAHDRLRGIAVAGDLAGQPPAATKASASPLS